MRPLTKLVTTIHGSQLYGTSTPASDTDYKGVHIPSGEAILLQRPEDVLNEALVSKDAQGKNTSEAIDKDSYSISKFCNMIARGDGVALDVLFTPSWAIVDAAPEWETLCAQVKTLINRQVSGYTGYCKEQAAKYGIKGSRMAAVEGLLAILRAGVSQHGPKARINVMENELRAFAAVTEGVDILVIETTNSTGVDATPHIDCFDKKFGFNAQIGIAANVFGKIWDNYGKRARAAKDNEGIDWKAVSHAVRVARQAEELLTTGDIVFPRPDAEELLAIKLGKFPYAEIAPVLEALIDNLQTIESAFPQETTNEQIEQVVLPYYRSQIA